MVVGSGSIGRRHLRNLRLLGIERLGVCDLSPERMVPVVDSLHVLPFSDYDEALRVLEPDIVFVCTPPVFHVPQALQALRAGAHVFVEKPLSHSLDGVEELIVEAGARRRIVQVGYNMRFHPGPRTVKRLIDEGVVGRVLWMRLEAGQYLPDWRPWQDYRQSYTARNDLGGGILLDGSHEVDYLIWFMGKPAAVMAMAGRVSDLQVDVEDCATLLIRFPSGAQADVHLDFVQRGYARSCKVAGERGTILWDEVEPRVRVFDAGTGHWTAYSYNFEDNEMYLEETRHFLNCIATGKTPLVDLPQAAMVLRVVLAAKRSSHGGSVELIA